MRIHLDQKNFEGVDSLDKIKDLVISNNKEKDLITDEWRLVDVKASRVRIPSGSVDIDKFSYDTFIFDDADEIKLKIRSKFILSPTGELYATASSQFAEFEVCSSSSFPLTWDYFAYDGVTAYFEPPGKIFNQFQIRINSPTGKIFVMDVDPSHSVDELKKKIWDKKGFAADQQRLIFHGRQMEDGRSLNDYNVQKYDEIYLVFRLRGGMYHPAAAKLGYAPIDVSTIVEIKYGPNPSDSCELELHEGETRESLINRVAKIKTLQDQIEAIKSVTKKRAFYSDSDDDEGEEPKNTPSKRSGGFLESTKRFYDDDDDEDEEEEEEKKVSNM
jgi:hypothetical protein